MAFPFSPNVTLLLYCVKRDGFYNNVLVFTVTAVVLVREQNRPEQDDRQVRHTNPVAQ